MSASFIRRNGWSRDALGRAVSVLRRHLPEAEGRADGSDLAAELVRWLEAAAQGEGRPDLDLGSASETLPPVPAGLERVAEILGGPEEKWLPRLREECADPVDALISLLDDLRPAERYKDPDLPEPHRHALPLLGKLSTHAAVSYILRWMNALDQSDPDEFDCDDWIDKGLAVAALEHVTPKALFDAAIELWPSVGSAVRERVAFVAGERGFRDDRFLRALVAWLDRVWSGDESDAHMAVYAAEEYGDPAVLPSLFALIAPCAERSAHAVADALAYAIPRLGGTLTVDQMERLQTALSTS